MLLLQWEEKSAFFVAELRFQMYQQYLNQAVRTLQNLTSDELKDLLNDDDKLDERVDQAVSAKQ